MLDELPEGRRDVALGRAGDLDHRFDLGVVAGGPAAAREGGGHGEEFFFFFLAFRPIDERRTEKKK